MIPYYDRWFGVVVVVFFVLLAAGFVAVAVGVGSGVEALSGRGVGTLVGLAGAVAWLWLLIRLDEATAPAYLLAFLGVPAAALAFGRLARWRGQ